LAADKATAERLIAVGKTLFPVAAAHLQHYLEGSGAPLTWGSRSTVSKRIKATSAFTTVRKFATAFATSAMHGQIRDLLQAGESIPTTLSSIDISQSMLGTQAFKPGIVCMDSISSTEFTERRGHLGA